MTELLFSIIVPVYNSEKYLKECIESILKQSFKNYEIILIDDGSVDNSILICEKYVASNQSISFYRIEHQGVSAARNIGIEKAKGKWIIFCDSDDYIEKNLLETLAKYDAFGYDIIQYGHTVHKYINEELVERIPRKTISPIEINYDEWGGLKFKEYLKSDIGKLSVCDKAFNRDFIILNDVSFVEGQIVLEDFTFALKCFQKSKKILILKECFYCVRRRAEDSAKSKRGIYLIDSVDIGMNTLWSFCNNKSIDLNNYREIKDFMFGWYMRTIWAIKKDVNYKKSVFLLKRLFGKNVFKMLVKDIGGKQIKIVNFLVVIRMYNCAVFFIKKIYR